MHEYRLIYLCLVTLDSIIHIQSASIGSSSTPEVESDSNEEQGNFNAHKYMDLPLDERVKETEKHITRKAACDYLMRFGYLEKDCSNLKGNSLNLILLPALTLFQERNELPITGILDEATRHLMAEPRCDFPDILPSNPKRRKRFSLGQTKWAQSDLPIKIKFMSHSRRMKRGEQEEAMKQAAKAWERFSAIDFAFDNEKFRSTISIDFQHLDGLWGVLGRAWFPRVGRIAFEDGENWVPSITKESGKLSFEAVAMHELGHALGISHSNKKDSIMAAQYSREVKGLRNDDIAAIQKLYGPPPKSRKPETTAPKKKKSGKNSGGANTNKSKTQRTTTTAAAPKKRGNKNVNKTNKNTKKKSTTKKSTKNTKSTKNNKKNNNKKNTNNNSDKSRSLDLSRFFNK